jgi:hypothetical protein
VLQMRCSDQVSKAERCGQPHHRFAIGPVRGAVINVGEDVEMKIDHRVTPESARPMFIAGMVRRM